MVGAKAVKDIGEQITALRKKKGLSLRELAEKSGTDIGNLSKIENGKRNSSIIVLARIAEALECRLTFREE